MASMQVKLQRVQEWLNQKRWGFKLYRCTFNDDEAWEKCLNLLQKSVAKGLDITECNAAQHQNWHLDIINDKQFDNADWVKLREHFFTWAKSDAINEELTETELQRRAKFEPIVVGPGEVGRHGEPPRYTHFLFVDEESMKSILKADEDGNWDCAFVTAIDTWEKFKPFPRNLEEDKQDRDLIYDPGYSMRIPVDYIPVLYVDLIKGWMWRDRNYTWPPEIFYD
jgi:hypothetical protein